MRVISITCLCLLSVWSLSNLAPHQQASGPQNSQPASNEACLEKELADFVRPVLADKGRLKIGFLTEHINGYEEFKKIATGVINGEFSNSFVPYDGTLGAPYLYVSGTSVNSNGYQYIDIKLQIDASEILLPENADSIFDGHLAKIGDPIREMRGQLVFAEQGTMLPPPTQGLPFEFWNVLRTQAVQENVRKVLTEFSTEWEKAGQKAVQK